MILLADYIDRKYSSVLHNLNWVSIELALVLFANAFGRHWAPATTIFALIAGFFRYNVMLVNTGF